MDPLRARPDLAGGEPRIPAPRQLSRRHDPGAPHERGLNLVSGVLGIMGFVVMIRWATHWLYPHATGWRWWVLAVATPICVIAGARPLDDVRKTSHTRRTRIGIGLAAVSLLAVLVFGLARL